MTIRRIMEDCSFIGLSTDSKPQGAPVGAKLDLLDTGESLIFDGERWVADLSMIYALSQAIKHK